MKKFLALGMSLSVALSAQAAEVGVTDKEVLVGTHSTESGTWAMFGAFAKATSAYFDMINEQGGVGGRKIKFNRIDTQNEYSKTVQAITKLVDQDKVFAIVSGTGTSHQAVFKTLAEKKVPDMFFLDGASMYGETFSKWNFPIAFSWTQEGLVYGDYITQNFKGKKICFIGSPVPQGKEVPAAVTSVVEKFNKKAPAKDKITIGPTKLIVNTSLQADAEVLQLKQEKCDAVVATLTGTLSATAINFAHRNNFNPSWIGYWFNANSKYLQLLDEGVRNGIVATVSIAPDDGFNVPGWETYVNLMKKHNIPVSGLSSYGYFAGEAFVEALKRASAKGELTRESFVAAAETMNNWTCSLCLASVDITSKSHWAGKPTLIISKDGKWARLEQPKKQAKN